MTAIKNIVFDFGGVLVDWNPKYLFSKEFESEERMNFFLTHVCNHDWNIQQDAGRPFEVAVAELQKKFPEFEREIMLFWKSWPKMLGESFPENVALIKPLKENYKVYGLTNWSDETIGFAQERFSFFQDLDGYVVSGREKTIKPDEQIYNILLDRFNIVAEESVFIDDSLPNIQTAQRLGFKTIHFTPKTSVKDELKEMGITIG